MKKAVDFQIRGYKITKIIWKLDYNKNNTQ